MFANITHNRVHSLNTFSARVSQFPFNRWAHMLHTATMANTSRLRWLTRRNCWADSLSGSVFQQKADPPQKRFRSARTLHAFCLRRVSGTGIARLVTSNLLTCETLPLVESKKYITKVTKRLLFLRWNFDRFMNFLFGGGSNVKEDEIHVNKTLRPETTVRSFRARAAVTETKKNIF